MTRRRRDLCDGINLLVGVCTRGSGDTEAKLGDREPGDASFSCRVAIRATMRSATTMSKLRLEGSSSPIVHEPSCTGHFHRPWE